VLTSAHRLPFEAIIHAPGPIWKGGKGNEAEALAACYRNALAAAIERGFASIGFCSISTGVYGYPVDQAAEIALDTVAGYLREHANARLSKVLFAMFGEREFEVFGAALEKRLPGPRAE
jgi:O-acetyl-ADP-ribose deacetylase (regulator of RNase III)